ncbi:DUF1360 domain-containing protein [Streptoverticillium reticulum]|uniref:DUF1360 domain-containing protein n=1 Tax=Streptoverticillium reticulum TaxID=1433415 RepID=UPI0039BF8D20
MAEIVITFLLALGTTARLTRLVAQDTLLAPWREKLVRAAHRRSETAAGRAVRCVMQLAAEIVHCTWCASVWVAAVVTVVAYYFADNAAVRILAVLFTLSYLTGLLATWLDPAERDPREIVHHFPTELRITTSSADGKS